MLSRKPVIVYSWLLAANSATALGSRLVISKDIARDMGGHLSFESDHDGACFRLTLLAAA